jgi:hypothetical protein
MDSSGGAGREEEDILNEAPSKTIILKAACAVDLRCLKDPLRITPC